MARLVAAFGCSHSVALGSPAQDFAGHAGRDEAYAHHLDSQGNPVSYGELLAAAPPALKAEITPEKIVARVAACERAIGRLAAEIAAARLDALVVVGDDQREQFLEDNTPAFLVYCGESIRNMPLEPRPGIPQYLQRARAQYHETELPRDYPVARDLALHVTRELIERDFDVACSERLPRARGEGHAFGFVHRRLLAGGDPPAVLPLMVNTYYPPNQPTPRRCFALGRAVRLSIESFSPGVNVGILASGGLSHFTIDEALDRAVLEACRKADGAALAAIPPAKLNSGSSEIRNWIVTAGAAERLKSAWQEYVPLYRTPAGTGCGMAFAAWQ